MYTAIQHDRVDTHHKVGGRSRRPDFTARTLAALHGIMELDWKREMQKEREHVHVHVTGMHNVLYNLL